MGFSVLKFGGSSVADATNMSRVLDIVGGTLADNRVILVSSAISGCTDGLLACAAGDTAGLAALKERHQTIVRRLFTGGERAEAAAEVTRLFFEMQAAPADEKVTFGELLSTRILARKLSCEGYKAVWLDSRELVVTLPGSTEVDPSLTYPKIQEAVAACPQARIFVAPGFIARTPRGRILLKDGYKHIGLIPPENIADKEDDA